MEHLYERLQKYGQSDYYPLHMPGHKRGLSGAMPADILKYDITEIDGFDNLHEPSELLLRLQQKAAGLCGAEESFYLINGSTGGILSAVSAALPRGGHLLMARGCHRSVYHAAYLRNLKLSYLAEEILADFGIREAVTPRQVEDALEREREIEAVLIVSPTYEGRIADVEAIAEAVHRRGIPLIVDGAHGAHLGLAECIGRSASECGADLVINSVHKTLPAMTQTALLHVSGNRIDRERLRRFLHIFQTSSPSYVLMASIDNALTLMEERGEELLGALRDRYLELVAQLSRELRYLRILPWDERQDVGKMVIHRGRSAFTGQELYEKLRSEYHLQPEMACSEYCLVMFTVGDTPEGYERVREALLSIDKEASARYTYDEGRRGSGNDRGAEDAAIKAKVSVCAARSCDFLSLAEAWDSPHEQVVLAEAVGRVAGEFIGLYPPGIPLIVPGEPFTAELTAQIGEHLRRGLHVQGVMPDSEG